jgi:hypothetical protein
MNLRVPLRLLGLLGLAVMLSSGTCVWAFKSDPDGDSGKNGDGGGGVIIVAQEATFGGSALAARLEGVPGVTKTQTGWNGRGPFLGAWFSGWTGHRRVSRIRVDPKVISFEQLLATVRERSTSPWVSFYARDAAQAAEARASWPLSATPRLVLRRAEGFRSAAE